VLDLEKIKTTQALEITSLIRRVKKLEKKQRSRTHNFKRLYKVGLTARVDSSEDEQTDAEVFDVNNLRGEEVFVEKEVADKEKSQDKGKAIMIKEHVKLKKKYQIRLDEEASLRLQAELQAEFDEEERIEREKAKKELEANIALIDE
nr:hypothetical protein [Tanacetum cinerariifolium]